MPLPILRLPELIQAEVLLKLEPLDLLAFSLISSKTKAISQYSNFKIGTFNWKFHSLGISLILDSNGLEILTCQPLRSLGSVPGPKNRLYPITLTINQQKFTVRKSRSYWFFGSIDSEKMDFVGEYLTKQVFEVFRIQDFHVHADTLNGTNLLLNRSNKLKSLSVLDTVDSDQFATLLEKLTVEELQVRINERIPTLIYSGPLKMEVLNCENLDWIVEETVWNMKCKKVTVKDMSDEILRGLIQNWMAGKLKCLEEFTLDLKFYKDMLLRVVGVMETERVDDDTFRFRREDGATARLTIQPPGFVFLVENNY